MKERKKERTPVFIRADEIKVGYLIAFDPIYCSNAEKLFSGAGVVHTINIYPPKVNLVMDTHQSGQGWITANFDCDDKVVLIKNAKRIEEEKEQEKIDKLKIKHINDLTSLMEDIRQVYNKINDLASELEKTIKRR